MKRLIGILGGMFCLLNLSAQSVSKELATQMALQYMRNDVCNVAPSNYNDLLTRNNRIDISRTSTFSLNGKAPLYVVQMQEGWVLVASEFVSTPILASAPNGQFPNYTDMPDGLKWLLSYYENAMQYTRDSLSVRSDSVRFIWEHLYESIDWDNRNASSVPASYEIDSIRSFLWNQNGNNSSANTSFCDKVYDKFCPTWYTPTHCNHTYVGCTAVAMGIVMRYYKWPYSAFIPNTIDSTAQISVDKHLVSYNWDKMPGSIYNSTDETIADEIAGFLRDCGYAAKMKYRANGSGASFDNAEDALENNFHYSDISYKTKRYYLGDWINKLKTEIASDRPVIYAGYGTRGHVGHAFVLYGYTPSNKFKINWGWADTALNNGAYSLDSLTPPGHNYNDDQEAIWGIVPKYPTCGSTYNLAQSDVNTDFEIYNGGAITASNVTINNGISGVIISGESVILGNGFKIEAGSHVIVDVKDMHCNEERNEVAENEEYNSMIRDKRLKKDMCVPSLSVSKILRNNKIFILRGDTTYTLTGQKVK